MAMRDGAEPPLPFADPVDLDFALLASPPDDALLSVGLSADDIADWTIGAVAPSRTGPVIASTGETMGLSASFSTGATAAVDVSTGGSEGGLPVGGWVVEPAPAASAVAPDPAVEPAPPPAVSD